MADLLSRAPDCDAIFCNNDDLALGALFECQRRQIVVPEQMGICGFNDLEMMAAAHPPITSVRTYREDMGHRAMALLIAAMRGEDIGESVVDLGFRVMPRASSATTPPTISRDEGTVSAG